MTAPLRVVHAIRSDGFAGVERHVCVLARAQAARGDEVTVIGGEPNRMAMALQDSGVRLLPGATVLAVTMAIIDAARQANLVHTHMTAADFAASLASLAPGRRRPVVSTRHFAAPRGTSRWGRMAADFIAGRISAQIAISRFVAERVEGGSEIVYPGVETAGGVETADGVETGDVEAAPAPEEPREPAVLMVQRLEPEKRADVAVAAFAQSGLAQQGWRLRIAGDGALREDLQQQASDLGIAKEVDFLGTRTDVPQLMAGASIMLAPCPIEGLGLGVLEAMGASLPVVASHAGGHLETLPRDAHQYCFAANDAEQAGRALRALADDPELRQHQGRQGLRRQQQHFTPAAQAAGTAAVYDTVLTGRADLTGSADRA